MQRREKRLHRRCWTQWNSKPIRTGKRSVTDGAGNIDSLRKNDMVRLSYLPYGSITFVSIVQTCLTRPKNRKPCVRCCMDIPARRR